MFNNLSQIKRIFTIYIYIVSSCKNPFSCINIMLWDFPLFAVNMNG